MRSSPRRRHAPRSLPGLWLAALAVLILAAAPLLAGRAHAGMRDCMAPPSASAGGRHPHGDATCAAACALCGQVVAARAEPAASLRRTDAPAVYTVLDRRPAGVPLERATPPPR